MNKIGLPEFKGNPLLLHAISHSNIQDVITLLEDKEADVNACNINGSTALHYAVQASSPIIVDLLLKFKANPNLQEYFDVGMKSPLHHAVEKNQFQICQLLLDYGANPSLQDKRGMTSLHLSARAGFKQITVLLITTGVDANLRDGNGFNASYWAQVNKHHDLLTLLPPPKAISPDDLLQFKEQMQDIHKISLPKKKKKKKKKK